MVNIEIIRYVNIKEKSIGLPCNQFIFCIRRLTGYINGSVIECRKLINLFPSSINHESIARKSIAVCMQTNVPTAKHLISSMRISKIFSSVNVERLLLLGSIYQKCI